MTSTDELSMIRQLLSPDEPPVGQGAMRARAALDGAIRAEATGAPASRRTPASLGRRLSWSAAGTGLVAAAVAAVVALSGTGVPTSPGSPPDAGDPATTMSAQQLLLAAAERAAREPVKTGRYWHVRTIAEAGPIRVGDESDPYWLTLRTVTENWEASKAGDASWNGSLRLGVFPRTDADRAAWEADGKPTKWDVGEGIIDATPGVAELREHESIGFLPELGPLSTAEVQELPTDPNALRTALIERITAANQLDGPPEAFLFSILTDLLLDAPAPPAVRAAAFRLLATVPHVTSKGETKDSLGRKGTAIEHRVPHAEVDQVSKVIIDTATYRLLSREYVATKVGAAKGERPVKAKNFLVTTAEWTDAKPKPPTA